MDTCQINIYSHTLILKRKIVESTINGNNPRYTCVVPDRSKKNYIFLRGKFSRALRTLKHYCFLLRNVTGLLSTIILTVMTSIGSARPYSLSVRAHPF